MVDNMYGHIVNDRFEFVTPVALRRDLVVGRLNAIPS